MKQTEIGLIPDDWEVKEIKDFADVTTGDKNTQDAEENGKYPFYVRSPIVERINKFSYDTEGVITAGDGVGTGKVFHYAKGKFGLHQRAYLIYNFKNTDPKYFYYNFSKNFYERVHSMTAKSSVDSVRREMITKMQIPIPPTLAEQQRIAKALSDVDALISTTEKLIQKKKNIKQGAMQNLLTGKKRLPGFGDKQTDLFVPNGTHTKEVKDVSPEQIRLSAKMKQTELGEIPEDWEVKTLGEMLKIGHGKDYKNLKSGNVPVYGTGGYMTSVNDFLYEGETVCIGRKGTIDKPQYHSGKIWTVDTLFYTYDFKSLNPKYLFYKFCLIDWLSMNEASGVPSLTAKNIEDIQITIPTEEEQTAIANVLSSMDKEIETLNTKLEKYRNLKTAMMQQLLTGKIRLNKGVYS